MTKERVLECLEQVLADPNGNISAGQSAAIALAFRIIDEQASERWSYFRES